MYDDTPPTPVLARDAASVAGALPELAGQGQPDPVLKPSAALTADADFLGFYGLQEMPFSDAVNPKYFYKTDGHDEAFIRLLLAIRHDISLGLVTGPSGSGKTLLSQMVLQNIDPVKLQAALVLVSPGMSKTALLRSLLEEVEVAAPEGPFVSVQELLKLLHHYVIDLHHQGKKLVVLVDECHFLSSDSLHMIRTISNLEVPERKLATILLFGEDRFLKRLENPSYESLRNRMYLRSELRPLGADDTAQYVKFRLLMAGRMDDLFDAEALAAMHEITGGICRRINKLGMLLLIEGYLRRQPLLDAALVRSLADRI
jgi:general secretion pathway protein A